MDRKGSRRCKKRFQGGIIMANIKDIQFLRQETGAGIMDCKNALAQTNGNL